ncbi:hypothetical protein F2P56_011791 [Juglans regia]|uniref:Pectinesterase inhibitor domain-containing protein n=1 Tax=Juglans regia TaxID=51240 RepID=A0A833XU51_JUGRE|nr:hypothetical protein F2P56_011791 [Juglans regia]
MGKLFMVLVLAIFLGLISEQHLSFVKGDAALIKDVCYKTTIPFYCKKCYQVFRQSSHEDVKALGRTAIDCSRTELAIFQSTFGDFYETINDAEFKRASGTCLSNLVTVGNHMTSALQSWQGARYADSANQMLTAHKLTLQHCGYQFITAKLTLSLAKQLDTLMGFSEISNGVLKQIH